MKSYKLKADVIFSAGDLDNAFAVLAAHFNDLAARGCDADQLFDVGEIELSAIQQVNDSVPGVSVEAEATSPTDERIVDYFMARNPGCDIKSTIVETLELMNAYAMQDDKVEYISNILMEEGLIPRSMKWRRQKCGKWLAGFLKMKSSQHQ